MYMGKNTAFGISDAMYFPYDQKGKMHIFFMTHFFALRYHCD